ncbi:hypothetical protein BDF14DRAFT_1773487 [Spinellus fusiger]|nr:hypothetical protein BDF14DRAFT_1773487 [Spinellus fusiger]
MTHLKFYQPTIEYRNKTWTWYEFTQAVRIDIKRAALKHSGSLLKQKLKLKNYRHRLSMNSRNYEPFKPRNELSNSEHRSKSTPELNINTMQSMIYDPMNGENNNTWNENTSSSLNGKQQPFSESPETLTKGPLTLFENIALAPNR